MAKPEAVERWRVRRDLGGAAALARRAAVAGDVSLIEALEPVVDLVTAVDPTTKDSALHEAARRGRAEAWKYLMELPGAGDEARNRVNQAPWVLTMASTAPSSGRQAIHRYRNQPDCDVELCTSNPLSTPDADAVALMRAAGEGERERAEKLLAAGVGADSTVGAERARSCDRCDHSVGPVPSSLASSGRLPPAWYDRRSLFVCINELALVAKQSGSLYLEPIWHRKGSFCCLSHDA